MIDFFSIELLIGLIIGALLGIAGVIIFKQNRNTNLNNLMIVKKLLSIAKNKIKTGKKVKIKFVKDRPGHDLRYAINSNKIRKEIRWKPKININKGLEKTLDWYLDNQKYYSNLKKKNITIRLGNKK